MINGKMEWGPGGATSRDTNFYRMSAGLLRTDTRMAAGEIGAKLTWHKIAAQSYNNVASFSFAGIPQDYKHLRLVMRLRSTDNTAGGAPWHTVNVNLNNDGGSKYNYTDHAVTQTVHNPSAGRLSTSWRVGLAPKAWWGDRYGYIEMLIPFYRQYGAKGFLGRYHVLTTDDVDDRFATGETGGSSQILDAITVIGGYLTTGNLAVASEIDLYGGD